MFFGHQTPLEMATENLNCANDYIKLAKIKDLDFEKTEFGAQMIKTRDYWQSEVDRLKKEQAEKEEREADKSILELAEELKSFAGK